MKLKLALLLLLAVAAHALAAFRFYLHPEGHYRLRLPQTWRVTKNVQGIDRLRAPDGTEIRIPRSPGTEPAAGFTRVLLPPGGKCRFALDVHYGPDRSAAETVLQSLEVLDPVCGGHP